MKTFNVIHYNPNAQKFEPYDVIPYFVNQYEETVKAHNAHPDSDIYQIPVTFDEFKEFIIVKSLCQFWSRCEYEIILVDWPCQKHEEKWDIHGQIRMNLDIITDLVMKSIE